MTSDITESGQYDFKENILKIVRWMLVVYCAAAVFSISISQIAIFTALFLWVFTLWYSKRKGLPSDTCFPLRSFFIVFVSVTLLTALLGYQPLVSLEGAKALLHIGIFFLVINVLRSQKETLRCQRFLLIAAMIASCVGIYTSLLYGIGIEHRVKGAFSGTYAYMTFAGMLMMIFLLNISRFIHAADIRKEVYWWEWLSLSIIALGLLLSLTRNVWVGVFIGLFFLTALRFRWKAFLIPLILVLLYPVFPPQIQERIQSIANPQNLTNHHRLVLWRNGLEMIKDYPLFGVGQDNFQHLYDRYRKPEDKSMGNMHNSYLTILAERGAVGLAAWLAMITALGWSMLRLYRKENGPPLLKGNAAGSLSALIALMSAGFFESNFSDTEINMLFYFIMALPFVKADKKEECPL